MIAREYTDDMLRHLAPAGVPIPAQDIAAACKAFLSCDDQPLRQFETALRQTFGVQHVFLSSSGRASLVQLFTAMARLRPERNEILLPAYTSFSVPSAAVAAGLKVSLYDLDPTTLNPDLDSLRGALSARTLCVVVCHLFGFPCDMDAVARVTANSGAFLVDDAAQAMGATFKGRLLGTFGDAGLFSLSRGKNLTTVDGGILVTNSAPLAAEIAKVPLQKQGGVSQLTLILKAILISLLLRPGFYWIPRKMPFLRLGASVFDPAIPLKAYTPCQAAIGLRMLGRLTAMTQQRRQVAGWLQEELADQRQDVMPYLINNEAPVYLRFPLIAGGLLDDSAAVLGIVPSYPLPLHQIDELQPHLAGSGPFPGAERLARELRTLPTHAYVTRRDVTDIARFVKRSASGDHR